MNLEKLVNIFVSTQPHQKQLTKLKLFSPSFQDPCLDKLLIYYQSNINHQQSLIKTLINTLQSKNSIACKLKTISFLLQISKTTQFDIAQIILNKKLKLFYQQKKQHQLKLDKKTFDAYILSELVIPIYNYLLKLSINQQLYKTCLKKQIPFNQIFRRGSKIRFIWIFKLYNLLNLIIPILQSIDKIMLQFSTFNFLIQLAFRIYRDLLILNNFIVKALYQAAQDNFLIMPYFDMLQFYQSMSQQSIICQKINFIYQSLSKKINSEINYNFPKPTIFQLSPQIKQSIEVQALRVKLISHTLKNPKKDHTILQTQYNQKRQMTQNYQITHQYQITQHSETIYKKKFQELQ